MNRYESLTGIDLSEQSFLKEGEKKNLPNHSGASRYRKFSEKPAPSETITPSSSSAKEKPRTISDPRAGKNLKIVLWIIGIATFLTLWIWEIAYVRHELTVIEQLKEKKLELEKQNEAIRADMARYTIYERIERVAREHLDLSPATEKPGVIFIDEPRLREAKKNDSLYRLQEKPTDSRMYDPKP